ncbi:hypothetical protein K2173_002042 [Erythroxylum novogranatense]|uniref:Tetratricopeptide repeat (TPR)-like superfamily protein n=1 Tax=Erythroxylum novogranatense TaxID=1862640 RepID=A0AAV8SQ95_9ROSI|nr:hypothetical protein K2173_002042 [Erythroxylum novogranatense]
MLRSLLKLSTAAATVSRRYQLGPTSLKSSLLTASPPLSRLFHSEINGATANPVALQMIDYALSLDRSQKSDESHAQAMLVLEQCSLSYSSESQDTVTQNCKGMALLAMSSLLSRRGNYDDAMGKLHEVQDLKLSSLFVRVAAMEALVGLNLELGRDDTSSVLANKCLEILESEEFKSSGVDFDVAHARGKAVKGLVELVLGNLESAESYFQGFEESKACVGTAALSYGEFLHATQNFQSAKDLYQKVIKRMTEKNEFSDIHAVAACNMNTHEVLLAANCALGQLEAHMGNFGDAEETLTRGLSKAEHYFDSRHPKVGIVLICLALMFRSKAIQDGLYRRAIELLKAPPLELEESRSDIISLARGGYGEVLCIQENRRSEGEKMKKWAEATWRNGRLSLSEALKFTESSKKVPVIDTRIGRAL